jgi:hypothetical protein
MTCASTTAHHLWTTGPRGFHQPRGSTFQAWCASAHKYVLRSKLQNYETLASRFLLTSGLIRVYR